MTTKKEAEKLPFDTLAERVMRKVPCPHVYNYHKALKRHDSLTGFPDKHRPCSHCGSTDSGTGTVLDPRWAAMREALWEKCRWDLGFGVHGEGCDANCDGSGFVRRNRAEAAYPLLLAAKPHFQTEHWRLISVEDGWAITKPVPDEHEMAEYGGFLIVAKTLDPLDALSAALLAYVDSQEVKP